MSKTPKYKSWSQDPPDVIDSKGSVISEKSTNIVDAQSQKIVVYTRILTAVFLHYLSSDAKSRPDLSKEETLSAMMERAFVAVLSHAAGVRSIAKEQANMFLIFSNQLFMGLQLPEDQPVKSHLSTFLQKDSGEALLMETARKGTTSSRSIGNALKAMGDLVTEYTNAQRFDKDGIESDDDKQAKNLESDMTKVLSQYLVSGMQVQLHNVRAGNKGDLIEYYRTCLDQGRRLAIVLARRAADGYNRKDQRKKLASIEAILFSSSLISDQQRIGIAD